MSAWITDRLPTIEDADRYGGVLITRDGKVLQWDWAEVKLGTPWQPITYPEPYVKPRVWGYEITNASTTIFVTKKGNRVGGLWSEEGVTEDDVKAMTDALNNKLEETP